MRKKSGLWSGHFVTEDAENLIDGRHAAGRPPLSIDISCSQGPEQQTRRTLRITALDFTGHC